MSFFSTYPPINGNTAGNNSVSQNGVTAPLYSTQVAGENPSGNLEPLQTDASGNLLVSLAAEPLSPLNTKDAADGTPGSANPALAIQVAGSDGTDLRTLSTNATGELNINNISGTVSLPTGAATAANQTTGNTSLASIVTNTGNIPAKGQTTMLGSTPVAIASDQTAIPVSASSLPLPTGAATSANQTNGSQKTQIVDGLGNVIASTSNALDVAVTQPLPAGTNTIGAVTQSGTWNITNVSGTVSLPTGASTAANQTAVIGPVSPGTAATNSNLIGGVYNSTAPTLTTGQQASIQLNASGAVKTDGSATTQPVSGTVTANQGTANATPWNANIAQVGGSAIALGLSATSAAIPIVPSNTPTSTLTQISAATISTQLLASNTSRKQAYFYNAGSGILYLALATSASTTAYTIQIASGGFYELPASPVYSGAIYGIWSATGGSVAITEIT